MTPYLNAPTDLEIALQKHIVNILITVDIAISLSQECIMKSAPKAISDRQSQSLSGIVRDELERIILSGELPGGSRLNEQALSDRLGVSRGPIREAMRSLEREGLVTSIANHGVFVRQIGINEVAELYDVRAALFGLACQRLASQITASEVESLGGCLSEMERALKLGDSARYYLTNLRFHDSVMEMARHQRVKKTYEALVKELHLARQRSLVLPDRMEESFREHVALLSAIVEGNKDQARSLAESHVLGGKRRWLEALAG